MLKLKLKKLISLISKTTSLHVQHTFFVYVLAVTARPRRQNAQLHVLWSKQVTVKFPFSF